MSRQAPVVDSMNFPPISSGTWRMFDFDPSGMAVSDWRLFWM
jgi:hypothetical protein